MNIPLEIMKNYMQLGSGRTSQEEDSRIKQMPPAIHYFTNKAYKILASSALCLLGAAAGFDSVGPK